MIADIVFNELEVGRRVYYRVKEYDKRLDVIRIEHIKGLPDGAEAINLDGFRKKHISIIYDNEY